MSEPIETAPKDGTVIDLWHKGKFWELNAYYKPELKTWSTPYKFKNFIGWRLRGDKLLKIERSEIEIESIYSYLCPACKRKSESSQEEYSTSILVCEYCESKIEIID
jgi:DNA-directed RNA polymerase subunit RPC12/RpoP